MGVGSNGDGAFQCLSHLVVPRFECLNEVEVVGPFPDLISLTQGLSTTMPSSSAEAIMSAAGTLIQVVASMSPTDASQRPTI
ncbi:hypothetical protein D3C85_1641200 [compost metagenome]